MSDPIDDKALDEYLKGGSLVSQRYRELGTDEVPDDLNRRVLDQARAAVSRRPAKSRAWMRWSAPVALAASAVLVLSIVIDSGVQQGEMVSTPAAPAAVPPESEAAAERQSAPSADASADVYIDPSIGSEQAVQPQVMPFDEPSASVAPPLSARRMTEKKRESAGVADRLEKSAAPSYAVSPAPPPPAPIAASEARAEAELEDQSTVTEQVTSAAPVRQESSAYHSQEAVVTVDPRRDVSTTRNAGPRDTIRARSPQASSDADDQAPRTYSNPEAWLEDIRQLRKDGETAAADSEWERFRVVFPDYPVGETDLARKK